MLEVRYHMKSPNILSDVWFSSGALLVGEEWWDVLSEDMRSLPMFLAPIKASVFHLLPQTRLSELCSVVIHSFFPSVNWDGCMEVYSSRGIASAEWMNKRMGHLLQPLLSDFIIRFAQKTMRKASWEGSMEHWLRVSAQWLHSLTSNWDSLFNSLCFSLSTVKWG